ncbi:MAG TPA: guanylate kinase [Lachnospiraceae bacterium]|nr:guanylate kinase [Lachnospiraceae bacterium]
MGKIFYLMGKSATGKDTLFQKLLQDSELNLQVIVPYTTRPIRYGEEEGREYHFTDYDGLRKLEQQGKVIESRCYHTCHGDWYYFTVNDGQIELSNKDYLIIGTLESYNKTREYFGESIVIPLLIDLEDGERLSRALMRERMQEQPKYQELCRRFLADSSDFSDELIKEARITRRFYNNEIQTCMNEIKACIKSEGDIYGSTQSQSDNAAATDGADT